MATLVHWIHVTTAVIGIGGMGFLLIILTPSLRVLNAEQREALARAVLERFRWVSWSVIILLLTSGLYNVRQGYWERPWGRAWFFLTIKIVLAFAVFGISLALTVPLGFLDGVRRRRKLWLAIAFGIGVAVIYVSAYLRRG
jgi:uncharacterized membrane protein